ncbi:MAG: M28 family metallopeptidase [Bryobacteraceae bacterium]
MTHSVRRATKVASGSVALCVAIAALLAQTKPTAPAPPIPPAINSIAASQLKGDLSFLASDALAGRYSPSPGLDVAAEFIASQFRAAGLEPGGDQDYFQLAKMVDRTMPKPKGEMTLHDGSHSFTIAPANLQISDADEAATLEDCPVVVFRTKDLDALKGRDVNGKAVVVPERSMNDIPSDQREAFFKNSRAFDNAIRAAHAKAEILVGRVRHAGRPRLIPAEEAGDKRPPVLIADNDELKRWLDNPTAGSDQRTVTFDVPPPDDHPAVLKNVVGILRGSDPNLKHTCVLLTAHYDHIGTRETGNALSPQPPAKDSKDQIYNGANDDGSGTVSVIEIAKALSRLPTRPKRSVVFVTFFGEERGDIGSGYYGRHPVFPIDKTVADVNLEQVGRTDSTEGKQISNATLTGFDYSDVTRYLQEAGRRIGVTIYFDKQGSDDYFERSDNAALARQGVPAHTLCVAFDYPDYHGLGDEWQKVDYANMAKVDRAVALGLLNIANSPRVPQWNANNPKTRTFREAQAKARPAAE